jgi:hypothetical protein
MYTVHYTKLQSPLIAAPKLETMVKKNKKTRENVVKFSPKLN